MQGPMGLSGAGVSEGTLVRWVDHGAAGINSPSLEPNFCRELGRRSISKSQVENYLPQRCLNFVYGAS
jgi:hypothetical protein